MKINLVKKSILFIGCFLVIQFLYFFYFCVVSAQKNEVKDDRDSLKASQNIDDKSCKVKGRVLGREGYIVLGVTITFKNKEIEKRISTNEFGEYDVILPKGLYKITANNRYNTLAYKRALVKNFCEKELTVNIFLLPKRVSYGDESPEYQFQSFSKPWSPDEKLDLVISYLSKAKKNYIVTYTDTMLTYNNLTISANKIIQNFKNKTIGAEGDIWLEDGKKRTNYEKLTLKFSKNGIKIEGEEKLSSEDKRRGNLTEV